MEPRIIGQNIITLGRVGSTNNYATSQVRENEVLEGSVFLAVNQSEGRGQQTNRWESEPGKNLTFSIVLYPEFLEIIDQFLLSKVVCLGLERFLSELVPSVSIKWPNDIYVGDRKICGMLIENAIMNGRFSSSVVGIGLNVNQEEFVSDAPNPVSLAQLTGKQYDLREALETLLAGIDFYYHQLMSGCYAEISRQFESKLYRLHQWHWFEDERRTYRGKIVGVNKIGQLQVVDEDGMVNEYHFKEVSYLI